jgi:2-polyprenyl-3-methyl-5-hydroxy-6-metoxy-1,4-benzoquinol methylase
MELEVIHCPLCGVSDLRPYSARLRFEAPHFLRVRCKGCGLIFANPRATKRELDTFYQNYYDKGNFIGWKQTTLAWRDSYVVTRPTKEIKRLMSYWCSLQGRRFPKGQALAELGRGKRWLEVGAGLGKASHQALRMGFDVTVTELDFDAADFLRTEMGIQQIIMGELLDLDLPENYYVIVVIHHVLEHVLDPIATLQKICRLLTPGGIIFVGVPNLNTIGYHALRGVSFMRSRIPDIVDGIEHTFGFTPRTIRLCLQKSGFEVKRVRAMSKQVGLRFNPRSREDAVEQAKGLFENFFHVKMECIAAKPIAKPVATPAATAVHTTRIG